MSDSFDFAAPLAEIGPCWFCGREAPSVESLLLEMRAPAEGQPAPATIEAWPRRRLLLVPRGDACAQIHARLQGRVLLVQGLSVVAVAALVMLLPLGDALRGLAFFLLGAPTLVLAGLLTDQRGAAARGIRPSHAFTELARLHALHDGGWRQHRGRSRHGQTLGNEGVRQAREDEGRELLRQAFAEARAEAAGRTV